LKRRILTVLGMVIALLAVYTIAFRAPARDLTSTSGARTAADRLTAVAAQASEAAGQTGGESKPATAAGDLTSKAGQVSRDTASPETPKVWGSDPFVREWVMINELAELSLRAITMGGDKAYALINDQILEEGDQISGKRVAKIESEMVILEQGGRTFNLLLGE